MCFNARCLARGRSPRRTCGVTRERRACEPDWSIRATALVIRWPAHVAGPQHVDRPSSRGGITTAGARRSAALRPAQPRVQAGSTCVPTEGASRCDGRLSCPLRTTLVCCAEMAFDSMCRSCFLRACLLRAASEASTNTAESTREEEGEEGPAGVRGGRVIELFSSLSPAAIGDFLTTNRLPATPAAFFGVRTAAS